MYKAGSLVRGIVPDLCCPENSLTGRFASHISLLSAISCPIAREPTRDDEIWALHPGRGLAVPNQELAGSSHCLLPAPRAAHCLFPSPSMFPSRHHHHSHYCREMLPIPPTLRDQQGNWEPKRGQSCCNIYNTGEYPGFFITPSCFPTALGQVLLEVLGQKE